MRLSRIGDLGQTFATDRRLVFPVVLGVLLRLLVFAFQNPLGADHHFQVIQYMQAMHRVPTADLLPQSYHPPLYYSLALPLLYAGNARTVQLLSLALSLGTLVVFYNLVTSMTGTAPNKWYILLFLSALPQLILYQNIISNDGLAIFIGAFIYLEAFRHLEAPSTRREIFLALLLGLGLLTKAIFLAFIPPLLLLIALGRRRRRARDLLGAVTLFVAISFGVGAYKYVQSYVHLGNPFYSNLDANWAWVADQKGAYRGMASFLDMNILKLVSHPTVSGGTKHSLPLMLYGTLWYPHIPDSGFLGYTTRLRYLGSAIYVVALIPTALMAVGVVRVMGSIGKVVGRHGGPDGQWDTRALFDGFGVLTLLSCLALVVAAGLHYDVWTVFQARLVFPAVVGLAICLRSGLEGLTARARLHGWVRSGLLLLAVLWVLYLGGEVGIRLLRGT